MACHQAARAAAKAGHSSVFIMPDGIDGWVKAGKRVERS